MHSYCQLRVNESFLTSLYGLPATKEISTSLLILCGKGTAFEVAGRCCGLQLNALCNPCYDIEQYGIAFEASPRHASYLAMTGPFTRELVQAARLTVAAMPESPAL